MLGLILASWLFCLYFVVTEWVIVDQFCKYYNAVPCFVAASILWNQSVFSLYRDSVLRNPIGGLLMFILFLASLVEEKCSLPISLPFSKDKKCMVHPYVYWI